MPHDAFVPAAAWIAAFVTLLVAIAILPVAAPHFWQSNGRKLAVSILLGLPVVLLYAWQAPAAIAHSAAEYASFIVLLGSLFVISGGIFLDGDIEATPLANHVPRRRRGAGVICRDDRGVDAADSPRAEHEPGAAPCRAHDRVLHLRRVEHRRLLDPARRPAAVPRLPSRSAVHLDDSSDRPAARDECSPPAHLLSVGFAHARPRAALERDRTEIRPLRLRGAFNPALLTGILAAAALLRGRWR